MQALLAQDFDTARRLIGARQDLEKANAEGVTPLIRSAARGHAAMVRELLKSGVDVNLRDAYGATALSAAAHHGYAEILADLAARGADVNAVAWMRYDKTSEGKRNDVTPLMLAIESRKPEAVELLLKRGANPSYVSIGGMSALVKAASLGFEDGIRLLLAHGADPDATDSNGQTALSFAIGRNQLGSVRALLRGGTDPDNARGSNEGKKERKFYAVPLVQAIGLQRRDAALLLLEVGADIDRVDRPAGMRASAFLGMTPLAQAIRVGDAEMVELLLKRGANPNGSDIRSAIGPTPVHAAALWGNEKILDLLLAYGTNAYDKDKTGANALHYAASARNHAMIRRFVSIGLPINARTREQGFTPLMLAATRDPETVKLLAGLGADPRVKSTSGDTAMTAAAASGRAEILKFLQQYNP